MLCLYLNKNKNLRKLKPSSSYKNALKRADKYFSLYIRKRDEHRGCVTCNRPLLNKDCGHFISREYHNTRFDEKNASGQCRQCNSFKSGKQYEHSIAIDKRHGSGTAYAIYLKSILKNKNAKKSIFELDDIAQYYKSKFENLP